MTYLVTYVVPQFAKLYSDMNVQLPAVTRAAPDVTVTYRPYVLATVALLVVGIVGVIFWARTEQGGVGFDRVKLKLPVVGDTWIKFQVAQFCRTLSTLLAGGTPLVAALTTAAEPCAAALISAAITQCVPTGTRRAVAARGPRSAPD